MDLRADLGATKKRNICCLHRKTNPDSPVIQSVAQSLDKDIVAPIENTFLPKWKGIEKKMMINVVEIKKLNM
jgi:hypothetical protein